MAKETDKPQSNRRHKHDFEKLSTTLTVEYTDGDTKLYKREDEFKCKTCLHPMTSGSSVYAFKPPTWWKED